MDSLSLKWGTLKGWYIKSEAGLAALEVYTKGGLAASAMLHHDTPDGVEALCALIDAVDCKQIYLQWDGRYVSKEKAKQYVRVYGKK